MEGLQQERYDLAVSRLREIKHENNVPEQFREFFKKTAVFLEYMVQLKQDISEGYLEKASLEELRENNYKMYQDILPQNYDTSYGNPTYANKVLGESYGPLLSFLYTELRGVIVYAFENREEEFLICLELFLQIYGACSEDPVAKPEEIKDILYWYVNDYCQDFVTYRIQSGIDASLNFPVRLILEEDLTDLRYLYKFGEYVTEQEEKTAEFLNSLSESEIQAMAKTYTEGYRIGFVTTGKNLGKKKTVNIRFNVGFERMIRSAILQFKEMGLDTVIYRCAVHSVNKRGQARIGYYGAIPNPQFDYDHRNDCGIYMDEEFVSRKLRATQGAYEMYAQLADEHAGPAVVETFGEIPFTPEACREAVQLTEEQQQLQVHLNNEAGQITNRYIKGEERSFTIIAYPVPSIGENFQEIFRETVKINTLDYNLYQKIQQHLIDALDQGDKVHITGKDGNHTDLWIQLHSLKNPDKETNFENCVADVNIPVGEVFTSPVLTGTHGVLHVKKVFLNELQYKDLEFTFTDGKIEDYSCKNFESEKENKEYIHENILYHHETLPMGEFAIGTNTTAYKMAKTYGIEDKLPILIAEKMGPHFAVGDTCYSWAEDTCVYNQDGKEIIARDNEISILRKEDPGKAYFGCHTDITIPYEELDSIVVHKKDGNQISLIEDGKFVLSGTEILNEPLEK